MENSYSVFGFSDSSACKKYLLSWADSFELCFYLDSNHYDGDKYGCYEFIIGVGDLDCPVVCVEKDGDMAGVWSKLDTFVEKNKDAWLFGCLGYDLKNGLEKLSSCNFDGLAMPDLFFLCPRLVIGLRRSGFWEVFRGNAYEEFPVSWLSEHVFGKKMAVDDFAGSDNGGVGEGLSLSSRWSKEEYIERASKLLGHIHRGDLYEVNLCQEFYAERVSIFPRGVFGLLNERALAPFSAYIKLPNNRYVLCASPERFMKKTGDLLISQPIKGTARRDLSDSLADEYLKEELRQNRKERSENVMIVDLVRNDLTRSAERGTVRVSELFGVYSFRTVHHLISTVVARLRFGMEGVTALKYAFPMGSMTGAPKVRAMQLIEEMEGVRRGLFSGTIGYISPNGDFDFNVVIRSLLYNKEREYLSLQTGSALTAQANPASEYEECLLKAGAIVEVLKSKMV